MEQLGSLPHRADKSSLAEFSAEKASNSNQNSRGKNVLEAQCYILSHFPFPCLPKNMRHSTKTNTKDVNKEWLKTINLKYSQSCQANYMQKNQAAGKAKNHVKTRQGLPSTKKSEIIFKLISLLMRSTSGVALFMLRL